MCQHIIICMYTPLYEFDDKCLRHKCRSVVHNDKILRVAVNDQLGHKLAGPHPRHALNWFAMLLGCSSWFKGIFLLCQ